MNLREKINENNFSRRINNSKIGTAFQNSKFAQYFEKSINHFLEDYEFLDSRFSKGALIAIAPYAIPRDVVIMVYNSLLNLFPDENYDMDMEGQRENLLL